MINMQRTNSIDFFCSLEQVCFLLPLLSESASIFFILTTCFFGGMMASFDIYVFIMASENSCKIGRCQGDLLQRRPGTEQHRTVPGRASADVFLYRLAGAHPICDHAR